MDKSIRHILDRQVEGSGVTGRTYPTQAIGAVVTYSGGGIVTDGQDYYLARGHGTKGTPEMVFRQGYVSYEKIELPPEKVRMWISYRNLVFVQFQDILLVMRNALNVERSGKTLLPTTQKWIRWLIELCAEINVEITHKDTILTISTQERREIHQQLARPTRLDTEPGRLVETIETWRDQLIQLLEGQMLPLLPTARWIQAPLRIVKDLNSIIKAFNERYERTQRGEEDPDTITMPLTFASMNEEVEGQKGWKLINTMDFVQDLLLCMHPEFRKPRERSYELSISGAMDNDGWITATLHDPHHDVDREYHATIHVPKVLKEMGQILAQSRNWRRTNIDAQEAYETLAKYKDYFDQRFIEKVKFVPFTIYFDGMEPGR